MKRVAILLGLTSAAVALAQEATLDFDPEKWPVPSPPIADCAADYRERGRPTEKPVDLAAVSDLKTALDHDLKSIEPEGLAGFRALEPVCFYLLEDGRILMRDGRGIEYYFRQVPRWIPDRIDFPSRQSSQ
jgi:hypothetical protein